MDIADFKLLAQYNIWATQRLSSSLSTISDDDFYRDCGLFFKSISGTLNHLLVGEHYLWFQRFESGNSPQLALNHILHAERQTLLNDLNMRTKNWLYFLDHLKPERLRSDLSYTSTNGQSICLPFSDVLLHVFNHGTHHRGQITASLSAMGYPSPELDLIYMLLEQSNNDVN